MTRLAFPVALATLTLLSTLSLRAHAGPTEYLAISGVPVELVSADALPSEWEDVVRYERVVVVLDQSWSFAREDILETDRGGAPRVVRFHAYRLPLEMRLLLDAELLERGTFLGIIDPTWLDRETEYTLNGRSTHEPNLVGIIEPSWIDPEIARELDERLLEEDAVAITSTGFYAEGITFPDVRVTDGIPVGIINPDSMHPGGWAGSGSWVSWEDCRGCWIGANPTPHP